MAAKVGQQTNPLIPGYQYSTIAIKDNAQIPLNKESTGWKVAKLMSLFIIPLVYSTVKDLYAKTKMIYHAIHDRGTINPYSPLPEMTDPNALVALSSLKNMRQLSPTNVIALDEVFKKKVKEKAIQNTFFFSANGFPNDDLLQTKLNEKKSVIIPLIIKGGLFQRGIYSRDHMTTLIIDPKKREIIFIDPKGKTLADYRSAQVKPNIFLNQTQTVKSIFQKIISTITAITPSHDKSSWTLVQRVSQYQYDAYNCGTHLLHNAREYAMHEKIPAPLDSLSKIRDFRSLIISEITWAYSAK